MEKLNLQKLNTDSPTQFYTNLFIVINSDGPSQSCPSYFILSHLELAIEMATSFAVKNIACVNEAKAGVPILTGIGYLDHMIDQWNSHAQVGVGLEVFDTVEPVPKRAKLETDDEHADRNHFASANQAELCTSVGHALGLELKKVILSTKDTSPSRSRFCCPLDEALVECLISSSNDDDCLTKFQLAPYGIYPRNVGRTQIGKLETVAIESFWRALATSAGISISLDKIRGDNAHHIGRCSVPKLKKQHRSC